MSMQYLFVTEIKCEYQLQYKSELHAGYLLSRTNYIEKIFIKMEVLTPL